MNEQLLKLAKEKGYICFYYDYNNEPNSWYIELCLLQKWIREKYNIWINIYTQNCDPSCFKKGFEKNWILSYRIMELDLEINKFKSNLLVDGFGHSYEETLGESLFKALKNIL